MKLLMLEEVASQARESLNFDGQCLREIHGVVQTAILHTCRDCGREKWLTSTRVRERGKRFTGYCLKCYWKHPLKGADVAAWKGGRSKHKDGYVVVRLTVFSLQEREILKPMAYEGGVLLEHRAIMALHLGRPLEKWEVVHHANGVRNDNVIENLELIPNNSEHSILTFATYKEVVRLKAYIDDLKKDTEYVLSGLDDYWITFPENKEAVSRLKLSLRKPL